MFLYMCEMASLEMRMKNTLIYSNGFLKMKISVYVSEMNGVEHMANGINRVV